jgi:hypothetical protein
MFRDGTCGGVSGLVDGIRTHLRRFLLSSDLKKLAHRPIQEERDREIERLPVIICPRIETQFAIRCFFPITQQPMKDRFSLILVQGEGYTNNADKTRDKNTMVHVHRSTVS